MSIYWSLKSVPELAPLTRKQRRRVHERCLRRHFFAVRATARSISAYVAAIVIASVFIFLGASIPIPSGVARSICFIISALVGFELGRFILSRIAIPVLRPFYREFIERDCELTDSVPGGR
jgi:NhaP-type Na+/H+ or K+/H+ antiporter